MKTTHTKQNKQLTGEKSKSLLTGSILAIIVAISPYIFYLYESLPETKTWETSLFTIESNYQENVRIYGWLFMQKAIPLLFLIFWFFTSRDWWYHVILIPIAMYTFQIISVIKQELDFDETEIYYIIPVMMIIIPIVYFIRIKLFDKYVYGIDLAKMDAELAEYERKEKEMLEANK
ncbi:hypothetical protein [uncultured Kordia sp.]|uniref:hypothetical protein n=1 Tax=uncultured Kordia sp. TaxID=507699 RepID=UPI0026036DFF|nr:hypothetical protein [uncultured Kordia sp.]